MAVAVDVELGVRDAVEEGVAVIRALASPEIVASDRIPLYKETSSIWPWKALVGSPKVSAPVEYDTVPVTLLLATRMPFMYNLISCAAGSYEAATKVQELTGSLGPSTEAGAGVALGVG